MIREEIEKLAPPWVEVGDLEEEEWERNVEEEIEEFSRPFTREELERALKCCKGKSSPRLDQIEYKMMKNLSEEYKEEMLGRFNFALEKGKLQKSWKENLTIFIEKSNKKKVRPITLLSCVEKIMERMINERLMWISEKYEKFDSNQNGFRRGKSSVDNLVRLVAEAELSIQTERNTIVAFLDISSAYDNVKLDILIEKLKEKRFPNKIIKYIQEWGSGRETSFIVGEEETERSLVNKRLPQGGVISPTLYNLHSGYN